MRLTIVSGLSGSGKSIALQTLEDLDYYCADNLPMSLLPAFVESLLGAGNEDNDRVAVGIDARNNRRDIAEFSKIVDQLTTSGVEIETLFLQCSDEVLVRRYSETRRRHPLGHGEVPLLEAIRQERDLMAPIAALADLTIDTSQTNVHQLRRVVRDRVPGSASGQISLLFCSFGYKHGIPRDVDFVFDVRCLPNPHWEAGLKELDGRDQPVIDYLRGHKEVVAMLEDIGAFITRWLPEFEAAGRSYLTVAIGCTGGQHRSVYLTEALAQRFHSRRRHVITRHQELS